MTVLDERTWLPPARELEPATLTGAPAPVARGTAWSWCAAALLAVLPLVADPSGWYVFVTARWALLAGAVTVLVGVAAVTGRLRRPAAAGWWCALVGVAVLSAAVSGAAGVSLFGAADRMSGAATWLVHGALAAVGATVVRRRTDLRVLVRGLSIGAAGVTVGVVVQRLGFALPGGILGGARPGGTLGNADFLGAYGTLALVAAIGAATDARERDPWRLLHVVAALGSAFCLVVSGTRAGWVGAVVGLVVFAVLSARRVGVPPRQATAVAGLVLVGLVGLGLWAGMAHRLGDMTSGTAAGRVATWERTATVIGERPVLGWGPEGFAQGFGRAVDEMWERDYGRRLVPDRAHNGLLDVGATLGLVGLAAYVGTIVATGRAARRALRVAPSATAVGVAAALVAYLVQQQFLFQLFDVDGIAWLMAGALAGLGATAVPARTRRSLRDAAALVVVGALVAVSAVAVGSIGADRSARRASDALSRDPSLAVTSADAAARRDPQVLYALLLADAALADGGLEALTGARADLAHVRRSTFDDGRLTLARSRLARAAGYVSQLDESLDELVALLGDDPSRADAWLERGQVLLQLDRPLDAEASLERAVRLAPDRDAAWVALAIAADRVGDVATARQAFAQVDPRVLTASELAVRARVLANGNTSSSAR